MKCMVIVHNYIFLRNHVLATPRYPPQVFGFQTRIHYRGFHPSVRYNCPAGGFPPNLCLTMVTAKFLKVTIYDFIIQPNYQCGKI